MIQDLYQLDLISNSYFDNIRGLLFPALFEEENNLVRIKELAQHSQQNELLKRLFLVKINQNFDQKSSNLYRELALSMGLNLNLEIQESSFFEQQDIPTFQEHIEDQQHVGKLKRSSSFSNDENGEHIQEKMLFYEIQNLFFGRIPLYVKSFLSSKKEYFQIHNQFNRVFFMDQNPFDLPSIYLIINSVCSFMECEYASNLFKSIQDFNDSQKLNQNLIPITEHNNVPKLDCLVLNIKDNLLVELVQSILVGEQINKKVRESFTNQQIYFAFFLVMHVSKICTLSFGLGIKNEIDLARFSYQEQNTINSQINQEENVLSYCQNQNFLNQFIEYQDYNLYAKNIHFSTALDETTDPSSNSTEIQEDEFFTETIFEEVGQREKIQNRLQNGNIDKNIEYQEFCISSIEPFLSSQLLQAIDESHRCLKTQSYPFEELLKINKEHLYYYIQCLLHIKNYQQNPKILEQIPPEIKKFIKYLVFYPNKIDKKIAHGLKKHLQYFEAFSQFVQFITDCLLFANLNAFEHQNQF